MFSMDKSIHTNSNNAVITLWFYFFTLLGTFIDKPRIFLIISRADLIMFFSV